MNKIKKEAQITFLAQRVNDPIFTKRLTQFIFKRIADYQMWRNSTRDIKREQNSNPSQINHNSNHRFDPRRSNKVSNNRKNRRQNSQYQGNSSRNINMNQNQNVNLQRNHRQHSNSINKNRFQQFRNNRDQTQSPKRARNKGNQWTDNDLCRAYTMHIIEHKNWQEIAKILNRTPTAVLTQVNLMRRFFLENFQAIPHSLDSFNLQEIVKTQATREQTYYQAQRKSIFGYGVNSALIKNSSNIHTNNCNKRSRQEFASQNPRNRDNEPDRKRQCTSNMRNEPKPKCQYKQWTTGEIKYAYQKRVYHQQSYEEIGTYLERSKLAVLDQIDPLKRYFKENGIDPNQFDFSMSLDAIRQQKAKELIQRQDQRTRRA